MARKQAVVENKTDHPDKEVAQLVRWVLREMECDDSSLAVRVKNSRQGLRGRFYPRARAHSTEFWSYQSGQAAIDVKLPVGCSHLITIGLPHVKLYPRQLHYYSRRETPPAETLHSWQEALVAVTAHEAQHHRQWKQRHRRASGRRRFQFVESECDFAGYRLLKRWRAR